MRPVLLALATALLFLVSAAAADGAKELRGSVAAVSATAITVKEGTKSLTCSVASTSPPLVEYHVGDRVTAVCKRTRDRWTLIAIHKLVTKPKTDQPSTKPDGSFTQGGKLTDVSATSVTVRDGDHDFVCKLGDTSPPLDGFAVGDHVVVVCKAGALVGITRVTVPSPTPPSPPVASRTGQGTISALSTASITVHTDGGDVMCSLGTASPKLGDYQVGDHVKFGCNNDVLFAIYKVDVPAPAPAPTQPPVIRSGAGTLTVLTTALVTVHTDGEDVSCRLGDGSPKLGDFHVGDHVKFYCTNDVLSGILRV